VKPRRPRKLFIQERREKVGLSQKTVGERLKPHVSDMTVSRWETGKSRLSDQVMAALAEVLDCEPEDFYHDPEGDPTPNQLLRGQPPDVRKTALQMLRGLRRP